jgi:hypothetical protein
MGLNLRCCCAGQICTCFGTDPAVVPLTLHYSWGGGSDVFTRPSTGCIWTRLRTGQLQADSLSYSCAQGRWLLNWFLGALACSYSLTAPYSNTPSLTFAGFGSCPTITVTL